MEASIYPACELYNKLEKNKSDVNKIKVDIYQNINNILNDMEYEPF